MDDTMIDPASVVAPEGHLCNLRNDAASHNILADAPPLAHHGGAPVYQAPVTVEHIFGLRCPVVRHLPARTLRDFSACMAWALDRYVTTPSDHNLFGVLALPRLCLRPVPLKGRFSITELEMAILRRLNLFRSGEWFTLWGEASKEATMKEGVETRATKRSRQGPHPDGPLDDKTVRRTRTLVADGASGKALQSLMSDGVRAASDPAVIAELAALHPLGPPVSLDTCGICGCCDVQKFSGK